MRIRMHQISAQSVTSRRRTADVARAHSANSPVDFSHRPPGLPGIVLVTPIHTQAHTPTPTARRDIHSATQHRPTLPIQPQIRMHQTSVPSTEALLLVVVLWRSPVLFQMSSCRFLVFFSGIPLVLSLSSSHPSLVLWLFSGCSPAVFRLSSGCHLVVLSVNLRFFSLSFDTIGLLLRPLLALLSSRGLASCRFGFIR